MLLWFQEKIQEVSWKGVTMSDEKDDMDDGEKLTLTKEQMLMDVLLRITAIENLLIAKNIVTEEEIQSELHQISSKIAKSVIEKMPHLGSEPPADDMKNLINDFKGWKIDKGNKSN